MNRITDHIAEISPNEPARAPLDGPGAALLINAVQQTTEAIVITDTSARIQFVNSAFTTITGYSADEVIGQSTKILRSDRQDPATIANSGRPSSADTSGAANSSTAARTAPTIPST